MRGLIVFVHITSRTGYHNIGDIIGTAARKGNDVIGMPRLKFRLAVVAPGLLPF